MAGNVIAIIPARENSKSIPKKNVTPLAGVTPLQRAYDCAWRASGDAYDITSVITTDARSVGTWDHDRSLPGFTWIERPAELAQDATPMLAVVQHVLQQIPGPPDQQIVLLQPTQPLRTPAHIQQALHLLTPEVDSVVSVVELHPREWVLHITNDRLEPLADWAFWDRRPATRQEQEYAYKADGTCYAFHRSTVEHYDSIYGVAVRPLIIPASETCALDTPQDWCEAERRLRERDALS